MRKDFFVFLSLLCWMTACSQQSPNKGVHTVDGVVPLYVDGARSGTSAPLLSPRLINQVATMNNLGDALHLLGPAYVAKNDTTGISRWHFSDGTTLTIWPQGGEKLSDQISMYPNPNCEITTQICKDLVLGRSDLLAEDQSDMRSRQHNSSQSAPTVDHISQPPDMNPDQPSTGAKVEQGLAGVGLQTINIATQGVVQRMIR